MRTTGRVVMLFAVGLLVVILRTPAAAQPNYCEYTALGLSCYYTINDWCNTNNVCLALVEHTNQGSTVREYIGIWPARVGATQCYHYNQTGVPILKNSYGACNPYTVY
jgi:hypothetical protein